ncbi:MAG: penicillin-binding transpeptidase domain-containing protein, partial [Nocardia sp.]|nr:penicillin-binding transpeptidase domain-containing protein [Nocardia sp.]
MSTFRSVRASGPARVAVLCAAVAVVAGAGACSAAPRGPVAAAGEFLSAFAGHDSHHAGELTDQPAKTTAALDAAWHDLGAEKLSARTSSAHISGDTATVDYSYQWTLPKNRIWSYSGQLQLGRSGNGWKVRWSAADIHPQLGDTQTLRMRVEPAPRARVNERAGGDALIPAAAHRITFDAGHAPDAGYVALMLSNALRRFDDSLTAEAILASAHKANGPDPVAELSDQEYDQVGTQLLGLPGVTVDRQFDLLPTDRHFAPDLMNQIRKTVIDEVDGTAGWRVDSVNADGVDTDVLSEVPPRPAPSFSLSLD